MIELSEVILGSEAQAEVVRQALLELLNRHNFVSVADYLELVGLSGSYSDQKLGWTELNNVPINPVDGGFSLDLPTPNQLVIDEHFVGPIEMTLQEVVESALIRGMRSAELEDTPENRRLVLGQVRHQLKQELPEDEISALIFQFIDEEIVKVTP